MTPGNLAAGAGRKAGRAEEDEEAELVNDDEFFNQFDVGDLDDGLDELPPASGGAAKRPTMSNTGARARAARSACSMHGMPGCMQQQALCSLLHACQRGLLAPAPLPARMRA